MKRVSDVDLRLLQIFIAVAESKGFTPAQSVLNISVSSISSYIAALEDRLGVRLCQRGRTGFALTEKGAIIYREAKRLFATLDEFSVMAGTVRGRLTGTLRLGLVDCTVTDPSSPVADAIGRFNRRDHEVTVELSVDPPAELQRGVLDGSLHLAVACFPNQIAELVTQPLYGEVNRFYCGAGHPLFERKNVSLEDLAGARIVARSYWRGSDISRLGVEQAAALVDIMEAEATLILSGAYIGYLPEHFASQWVAAGRLRCLLPERLKYVADFSVISRSDRANLPPVQQFLEDLRASAAKFSKPETPKKRSARARVA
jgi:DNA-binding transcriptional LysR family regulator